MRTSWSKASTVSTAVRSMPVSSASRSSSGGRPARGRVGFGGWWVADEGGVVGAFDDAVGVDPDAVAGGAGEAVAVVGGLVVAVGAGAAEVPPAGGAEVGVAVEVVVLQPGVVAAGHRAGRFGQVQGGAQSGVDGAPEVVDAADVVAVADDGFDEGVVDPAAGDLDGDGPHAADVAGLTGSHAAPPQRLEVDDQHQFLGCRCGGRRGRCRRRVGGWSWAHVPDRSRGAGVGAAGSGRRGPPAGSGGSPGPVGRGASGALASCSVRVSSSELVQVGAVACRGRVVCRALCRGSWRRRVSGWSWSAQDEVGDGVGAVAVVGLAGAGSAGGGEDVVDLGGQPGLHLGADLGLEAACRVQNPSRSTPHPARRPRRNRSARARSSSPAALASAGAVLQVLVGAVLVAGGVQQLLFGGGVLVGRVGDEVGFVFADVTVGQRVGGAVVVVARLLGGAGPAAGLARRWCRTWPPTSPRTSGTPARCQGCISSARAIIASRAAAVTRSWRINRSTATDGWVPISESGSRRLIASSASRSAASRSSNIRSTLAVWYDRTTPKSTEAKIRSEIEIGISPSGLRRPSAVVDVELAQAHDPLMPPGPVFAAPVHPAGARRRPGPGTVTALAGAVGVFGRRPVLQAGCGRVPDSGRRSTGPACLDGTPVSRRWPSP